jgi:hypothetical protein
MAAELTKLTHKRSDATAPSGRELYHLQFSLQVCVAAWGGEAFRTYNAPAVGACRHREVHEDQSRVCVIIPSAELSRGLLDNNAV